MLIKTRRILFYSLVIIFFLLGTFLVLNSRGYRLNLKTFQVEATGGIYINSTPSKTLIELDGKEIENQFGILQRGTLIDNLTPGEYALSIRLDGYSSWRRDVEVESGSVSVFDFVILVPQIEPTAITDSIANKIVVAGNHLAVESKGGVSLDGSSVLGHEIVALTDSGTLLSKSTVTENYYIANAFKPKENLNLTLIFNNLKAERLGLPGAVDIKKALPYPYTDRRFVIATDQSLYVLDVDKSTLEQITVGVSDFSIYNQNSIAWIEKGEIKSFNLPLKTEAVAFTLTEDISLKDIKDTSFGLLALYHNGGLTLLSGEGAETIMSSVKSFLLSPQGEGVVVTKEDNQLFVYNFEDKEIVEVDSSGLVKNVVWFQDGIHLLLLKEGSLIFAEVGDSKLENTTVLAEGVTSFSYAGGETVSFAGNKGVFEVALTD